MKRTTGKWESTIIDKREQMSRKPEKSLKMLDRFSKNHPTLGHPRRIKINRYNDNERICI